MKVFDLHTDTPSVVYNTKDKTKFVDNPELTQVLAMFYDISKINNYDELYKIYLEMLQYTKDCTNDIATKTFFSVEDAGVLNENMERLYHLYDNKVKIMTLLWNYPNCIGYPHGTINKGLTDFGRRVVRKMNELDIVIDVSHLSDEGFYDVIEISRKPVIASHSNARAVCRHTRNLKDDMIKLIAKSGGVVGLNFYNEFIANDGIVTLEKIVEHIRHIKDIGGIDCVAIGSDFDGFDIYDDMPVKNIEEMDKLQQYLLEKGFTAEEVEKIFYRNAERVIIGNVKENTQKKQFGKSITKKTMKNKKILDKLEKAWYYMNK